jgi:antagonist of KipI
MAVAHIIRPGLQTTVQDRGRWGLQSRGVPVAGPMDPISYRIANALVGNDPVAATLEIALAGPEIEFDDERLAAVAGAEFALTVDGRPQSMNTPFLVSAGSVLRFGARSRGARAYLAIAGGVDVPEVLGSRATHLLSRMGGIGGRALTAGDLLPLGAGRGTPRPMSEPLGIPDLPEPGSGVRIRVLPGPHREHFADDALDTLQSAAYAIRTESDRMGFRLQGPRLPHRGSAEMISDATPLGVLQVPGSGDPVMLMADRQTTGGYPIIATAISADIGVAGQLAPGDRIQFEVCSMREAVAALIRIEQALMALETAAAS